jgi:hypothetical protein
MKLVLLPGLDGTGKLFEPFINALPSNIEPVIIAYPENEYLGYEGLAQYVLGQLPKEERYYLLVESFSGPIGYLLAKKNLENMLGVIFVATFLHSPIKLLVKLSSILPLALILKLPIPNIVIKWFFLGMQADLRVIGLLKKTLRKINSKIISFRVKEVRNLVLNLEKININSYYVQALNDKLVASKELSAFEEISEMLIDLAHKIICLIKKSYPTACIGKHYCLRFQHT